jgi:hypothetical protein
MDAGFAQNSRSCECTISGRRGAAVGVPSVGSGREMVVVGVMSVPNGRDVLAGECTVSGQWM